MRGAFSKDDRVLTPSGRAGFFQNYTPAGDAVIVLVGEGAMEIAPLYLRLWPVGAKRPNPVRIDRHKRVVG